MQLIALILLFPFYTPQAQPSNGDYILGYGGLALFGASEYAKEYIVADQPNWKAPNAFDLFFRNKLKWADEKLHIAELWSDILAKGIAVPSIFWTPLLGNYKYNEHLLLNVQVLALTGLVINSTKFFVARQRPYSYFGTLKTKGKDDYLSFFSGHTGFPFAVATSTAFILQNMHPRKSALIWSSGLIIAASSGYLRIAADHHYMSDVLTGMVVGSLCGYLLTKNQERRFFKSQNNAVSPIMFSLTFKL